MSTTAPRPTPRLEDRLCMRVPDDFKVRVRLAAREAGVRPGRLVRDAVDEKIQALEERRRMSKEERAVVASGPQGAEVLAVVDRYEADPAFREDVTRTTDAFHTEFMQRIARAHANLGAILGVAQLVAQGHDIAPDPFPAFAAAHENMVAAGALVNDLHNLVLNGKQS